MHLINRRRFMKTSLAGAIGTALGSMLNVPGFLRSALADEPGITWNGNKLLFIFLRGGNDALNTVIPSGDPSYNLSLRPSLFVPAPSDPLTTGGQAPTAPEAGRAIDLGNGFATMHPALADTIPLYNAGELAFVHRVGYPNQSRSHFDSQRYWETGLPLDDSDQNGLLYRALVETGLHESQVMPAVSMQSTMPQLLKGDVPFANISDPSRYDLLGVYAAARQKHIDYIARMHGLPAAAKKARPLTFPTGRRFVNSINQVTAIDFADNGRDSSGAKVLGSPYLDDDVNLTHLFPIDSTSDDKGFDSWSAWQFFRSLKYSAQVLAHTDAVVSGTELDGFDTHSVQGSLAGGHARLLNRVGWGLYALKKYLSHPSINLWNKMIVVTMSEFGRTSEENGSNGTDHAEAGVMIVAGGAVNGGVYQCSPSDLVTPWAVGDNGTMFAANGRYLQRSVDYRSVLGELIRDHLGAGPAHLQRIIPAYAAAGENLLSGGITPDGTTIAGELGLVG
jgi:uncharacterized protein (DUF1501 family)